MIKKYQHKFREVKADMGRWEELQSRLLSQFTSASAIIQRLQVLQDSKNYGALKYVQGIRDAVFAKQVESLQTILLSMNKTLEDFRGVSSSLEKVVCDGRQLVKGGSVPATAKQLQQRVGIKPSLADCLDGLTLLREMHHLQYLLKLSVVSALGQIALIDVGTPPYHAQLSVINLIALPMTQTAVQGIFDIIFAIELS